MHQRFQCALRKSSELRALLVLMILFALRAYRRWQALPNIIEIIEAWQRRFNVWLTYFLYKEAHWI